jgi:predicted ATPase
MSFVVTDARYTETCVRLREYEEKYSIDNFARLKECDLLMLEEDADKRARYDSILQDAHIVIGERMQRCKELEG